MSRPIAHFRTITKHRHAVIRHCFRAGIGWQGLGHDLSKYSPAEFLPGTRYYQGTRSPTEAEREDKGYSEAWLHHKGRNRHHWEYWREIDPRTRQYAQIEMPVRYVAEMFCDRVAASKIYKGKDYTDDAPLAYFNRGNARNAMHPSTAALLEDWLQILAGQGEEAAFAAVKAAVKAASVKK